MSAANEAGYAPRPDNASPPLTDPPRRQQDPSQQSLGELFGEISKDVSTLMRQEVELAKAEITQSAKKAGTGAGMFSGAAVAGHMVLLFVSIALWWGLGGVIGRGWSALVVAALWAVAAAVLARRGRDEMRKISGLPRTAETVKKIPNALHGHEEKNL